MISLIVATRGRTAELRRLLKSLVAQTEDGFEVVVVDQNEDDRLGPILAEFGEDLSIKRVRSEPGLSRARNMGLNHVSGEMIGFPDDDCWYPPGLIEKIQNKAERLDQRTGLVGQWQLTASKNVNNITDRDGESLTELSKFQTTTKVMSPTLFLPRKLLAKVGGFDENLGLGSDTEWRAGEDIDIALRCLNSGGHLLYDPKIKVYHPDHRRGNGGTEKGRLYGAAMGHVLSKHNFPTWFACYHFLRSLSASAYFLLRGNLSKARYYWATFKGKVKGWRNSEKD